MIKNLTVLIVLVALAVQAQSYPTDTAKTAAEAVSVEKNGVDEAASGDDDLSGSETFGFGYYPGFYGGYGYGGRRFGGYGYGTGWGYGGYGGGYGYGGYYRRPIFPIFG